MELVSNAISSCIYNSWTYWSTGFFKLFVGCILGVASVYLVGVPYMYVVYNFFQGKTTSIVALLSTGMLSLLPFDIMKCAIAALIAAKTLKPIRRELFNK